MSVRTSRQPARTNSQEAASRLGLTPRRVGQFRDARTLRGQQGPDGHSVISANSLDRYLERLDRRPTRKADRERAAEAHPTPQADDLCGIALD